VNPKIAKIPSQKLARAGELYHSPVESAVFERTLSTLRKAGLKRTPNRESLLGFLIKNHGPFSKEEIQKALAHESMDSVTLYRNLAHFEEIGVIRRTEFGDGISRYEFQIHPDHHHHHVICVQCRKVDTLEICDLSRFDKMAEQLGYSKVKHSLEFYGICKSCR
jgi:Fe2+ or Zn2+ uptake regulation protein